MNLFIELLPVLLFFVAFKFYGIYVATVTGIVATFLQVFVTKWWTKKWDKKQLITLVVFVFFGGMTLYFHNPIFVKWKPTIVFWCFALAILGSQFITHKTIAERVMEGMLEAKPSLSLPSDVWKRLNLAWAIFFMLLGTVNLYIAYQWTNDAWVNFKFYGITSAVFVFSLLQAIYLSRKR